ncbi:MAG TPA: hypothetical protein VK881_12595 [bacterium]|nr:hypothetical protein [bacterium]
MPREVLADDIERFLTTVDGVVSARLLTSPSGEVDQIYITAEDATDGRAARRSVVAALMTAYGIPIEPGRIQVTHLRGSRAADLPDLKVVRVEETASGTEVSARVQVAWERAGERRTGTGQARGPAGTAHRFRTLAAAAIDAVRAVLEPAQRRVTLHQAALIDSMDHPVVLIGISAPTPRGPEIFIGAAPQRQGEPQAAVNAVLDAVAKWLLQAPAGHPEPSPEGDRRAHLEMMRHFVRLGAKAPLEAPFRQTDHGSPADPPTGAADAEPSMAGRNERMPVLSDIVIDPQEIRPEQEGGAAVMAHDVSPAGSAPARAGRQAGEDRFYLALLEARTPVHIRCRDGYEIAHAVLRDVGPDTLLVDAGGGTELLYKHAVISIRPRGASPGV